MVLLGIPLKIQLLKFHEMFNSKNSPFAEYNFMSRNVEPGKVLQIFFNMLYLLITLILQSKNMIRLPFAAVFIIKTNIITEPGIITPVVIVF